MVVEIFDTTLRFDMTVKAALYARAGIVEYWVLDIGGRWLAVHREASKGEYQSVTWFGESESVAPLSAPESKVLIASLFVV